MKRLYVVFIAGLMAMTSPSSYAASVQVDFDGASYDVTTITGTFNDLADLLDDQIWWNDSATAAVFAGAVGTQLGSPSENAGLSFSSWGPLFANTLTGDQVSSSALDVGGTFGFTVQGPVSSAQNVHTYAVVSAVPLPAGAWLLISGIAGLGVVFTRR